VNALTTRDAAGFISGGVHPEASVAKESKGSAYEVLVGFCVGGGVHAFPGDVIELTEVEARTFGSSYVRPTDKKVGKLPADPNHRKAIRNRDPKAIKNQDPK